LALKENNILLENMTNKMSILIEEKKILENIKPEALTEIVNSSSSEEILIYRICSLALVIVVGVLIYSYSKGTTPPPGGGGGGDDGFKSLVVQKLVAISEDNQIISEKIDDLIEASEPVETVKNVLLEWKFQ
jgi:hypothetical protein